jgi:hypothetical protein
VVDIMDALRRSVESAKRSEREAGAEAIERAAPKRAAPRPKRGATAKRTRKAG